MGSLHCDLNEELIPILLRNGEENARPHYLVDVEVEKDVENLNQSQIRAVDWCLNHKIAIVQGPPGMLDVICILCTNHFLAFSVLVGTILCKMQSIKAKGEARFVTIPINNMSQPFLLISSMIALTQFSGTGKSYLALKLIKMLSTIEDMRPILFVTVKNAVLDNALQKLIDMQVSVVLNLNVM